MYGRSIEQIVDMKVRAWEIRQEAARRQMKENKQDVTGDDEKTAPKATATQTSKLTKVSP